MELKPVGTIKGFDKIGRILIPKNIRNTLNIDVDTKMEVYVTEDGGIYLKKHIQNEEWSDIWKHFIIIISRENSAPFLCLA